MSESTSIAMIECGSMGGGMALLSAKIGIHVSLSGPSDEALNAVMQKPEKRGYHGKVDKYTDYDSLCKSLSWPRPLVFSLPHGGVGDKVLQGLEPHLSRGDIILDYGNEHFENTKRRQKKCKGTSIQYISCGVSGGY